MNLLSPTTITTSGTTVVGPFPFTRPPEKLSLQGNFVYGSGGASTDCYVQTSFDNGSTWTDVANFHFTTSSARIIFNLVDDVGVTTPLTPTDGGLASNTALNGVLDATIRLKIVTTGLYAGGTTLSVDASAR